MEVPPESARSEKKKKMINGMEALWFILAQEGDFYYWKKLIRASLLGILVHMVFPYTAVSSLLRDGTDSKQGFLQRMVSRHALLPLAASSAQLRASWQHRWMEEMPCHHF